MLHEQLRRAREQAGLSQARLAALAGIPRNQIVRAEKGDNITLDTLRKIAAHLPITELTLLDRVKLTTDTLPIHEKIYLGAMETLEQQLRSVQMAFNHARDTWQSYEQTRRKETPEEAAERGGTLDPSILFHGIERALKVVDQIQKTA